VYAVESALELKVLAAVSAIREFSIVINRLNLSSDPFRNRTIPWVLCAGILLVSVFVAIFIYAQWSKVKAEAEMVRTNSQLADDDLKKYQEQEQKVAQELTPQQKQLLIASHKLVLRKQFSWSRLFSDLENVLPGGVSVSQINVTDVERRNDRTEAQLEFGVLSRNYQNVVGMIDNMNSSGLFHAEMRGQDRQKSDGGDFTEFTLHVVYTPHYYAPSAPADGAESVSNSIPGVTQ
jgi:Tfp pilus assembly protein PilN